MTPLSSQYAGLRCVLAAAPALGRREPHRRDRGSALLAALCFATVLALALGSYITVCYRTLEMSSRTVQGTRSVELAETGMEEALWALNRNDWTGWTIASTTATKTLSGFSFDGGVTGSVSLRIANYDGTTGIRTVTATGTTRKPDGTTTSRTLTSSSAKAPLFVNAIAGTTGRVRFRVGGSVDSYDSSVGTYATQTPGFSAIISSGSTYTTAATVELTNAEVKGYVATLGTGPSYGTSGKLIGPTTPSTTRIDSSRIISSPYQPRFEEVIPTGAGTSLPSGSATIGNVGSTSPRLYYASSVNLNGSQELTVNGPVVLVVSGDFAIWESARIRITSTGSLRIHVGGNLAICGYGIQNDTKLPKKLSIISSSTNDTYVMATDTPFHGVVYTPNSHFAVVNSQTIYGAIVARAVTFYSSPVFHYDLALRKEVFDGLETPFAVTNWRETSAE